MSAAPALSIDILDEILKSAEKLASKQRAESDAVTAYLASVRIPDEIGIGALIQEALRPYLNDVESADKLARGVSGRLLNNLADFGLLSALLSPIKFKSYREFCFDKSGAYLNSLRSAEKQLSKQKAWLLSADGRSYLREQLEKRLAERNRVLERIEVETIKLPKLRDDIRTTAVLIDLIKKLFPLRDKLRRIDLIPGLEMFAERLSLGILEPSHAVSIIRLILNASTAEVELRGINDVTEVAMAQAEIVVNGEQEMALFGRNLHPLRLRRTEDGAELIVVEGPSLKLVLKEPERRILARMKQINAVVLSAGAVRPVSTIPVEA